MKPKRQLAWHFVGETLRDGSPIPKDGEWLEFPGKCVMCKSGLHASREPFDALQYAPGATLCLVEVGQIEAEQDDKLVCHRRRIIARMDATELCGYFARMQAVSCLDNWQGVPDQIVLDWLMTGEKNTKSAARSAAESVAWSAAESAAESVAWSAARSAARSAAWSAAESAAWSAARSATWSAARSEFTQLVYECFEDFL